MDNKIREKIDKIKEKTGPRSLYINRLPDKAKARLIEIAHEKFCDDYGMTIAYLIDFFDGVMPSGHEYLEDAIEEILLRLNKLEKTKEEPKKSSVVERIKKRKELLNAREKKKNGKE